jgi:hypothetical protein
MCDEEAHAEHAAAATVPATSRARREKRPPPGRMNNEIEEVIGMSPIRRCKYECAHQILPNTQRAG